MATLKQRKHRVNSNVSMSDLYMFITSSSIDTYRGATQVKCHIHGSDTKPSARIYEDTNKLYCFTCRDTFTPYKYARAFRGIPYDDYNACSRLLTELENHFNLNNIPVEDESKIGKSNEKWDKVLGSTNNFQSTIDYRKFFNDKWVDLNNKGCILPCDDPLRDKIFLGLDKVLLYLENKEDYKYAWEFLTKLDHKYLTERSCCAGTAE